MSIAPCAPAWRHTRTENPTLQRAPRTTKGMIWNPDTPYAPACPGQQEKHKRGLPAPKLSFSLSSFIPFSSSSISISLFLSLKISYIWYFYHLIPRFVLIHFLTVTFLAYLPIVFSFEQVREAMGSPWRRPKLSTMFLSILWNSKVIFKLKISSMSRFRKLLSKDLLLSLNLES